MDAIEPQKQYNPLYQEFGCSCTDKTMTMEIGLGHPDAICQDGKNMSTKILFIHIFLPFRGQIVHPKRRQK